MKRLLLTILLSLCVALPGAFALTGSIGGQNSDGTNHWNVEDDGDIVPGNDGNVDIGASGTEVDNIYVESLILGGETRTDWNGTNEIEFTPSDFSLLGTELTASTVPALTSANSTTAIVWADDTHIQAQTSFIVPSDYVSGGAFTLMCDSDTLTATTPSQVAFGVFVNSDATNWDAASTEQTAVTLTENAGSAETVTLAVATDFSALAGGDLVTFCIWRSDASDGGGVTDGADNLEVYGGKFSYTGSR